MTPLERPARAILALTAFCLLAFVVTVPLPRVDGELIGSDGIGYYVYLPSFWLDGDLDFADEYRHFYRSHPETAAYRVADLTPEGLPANRFGIGPAVLWSPFFLVAHLWALLLSALGWSPGTDGTSYFYQVAVLSGSIVYGGLGAWLCFRTALHVASQAAALVATLGVVLAGNLIYYLTVEPSMSHALSMFASSAFCHSWIRSRERWRAGSAPTKTESLSLGGLAGLMALIRPQDGLLLALPMVDRALSLRRRGGLGLPLHWLTSSLWMGMAAILVFLPQLLIWKALNGGFLRSGYREEFGTLFYWPGIQLWDVLFSAQRGLFVWHPIFLLAWIGLWLLFRRRSDLRQLAALGLLGFAIQWLVVSSWHDWAQGDAFGGRMFIVCTPIFIWGLAAWLDVAARRWSWRWLLVFLGLLIVLNGFLLVHYRLELLRSAQPITYVDLLVGRFQWPGGLR